MSTALLFGFVHSIWPEALVSFKRLHIFLFNLLTGGTLILYFSEGNRFTKTVKAYFALALLYALSAAFRLYIPTLVISLPLFLLVESVRIKKFSLFPMEFFSRAAPISKKFNQAALLCLSIGIGMASLVILNNKYLEFVYYEKLTLDVFFLGYSFPVSLITMSLMFSFLPKEEPPPMRVLKEILFWVVNLGVITFFVFIIFGMLTAEIIAATTLFVAVVIIFVLFVRKAPAVQQKTFLVSGIAFLFFTGISGIFYLLKYFLPAVEQYKDFSLVLHAMVALYGWNLSGLFIIIRWEDFPIKLNSSFAIALHWIIVIALAPLGTYMTQFGVIATVAYIVLLGVVFWGKPRKEHTLL